MRLVPLGAASCTRRVGALAICAAIPLSGCGERHAMYGTGY
jgi:hypothetical protein